MKGITVVVSHSQRIFAEVKPLLFDLFFEQRNLCQPVSRGLGVSLTNRTFAFLSGIESAALTEGLSMKAGNESC